MVYGGSIAGAGLLAGLILPALTRAQEERSLVLSLARRRGWNVRPCRRSCRSAIALQQPLQRLQHIRGPLHLPFPTRNTQLPPQPRPQRSASNAPVQLGRFPSCGNSVAPYPAPTRLLIASL
jgi:hypothetical protein